MDLQELVSDLADRLNRPVAVNDFDLNLLAASAQALDIDEYRVESILRRRTPSAVVSLLHGRGLLERSDPFVLEGGLLPGLKPRMCVPISVKGRNVAFLWIVMDNDESGLTSTEYGLARAAAEEIRALLAAAPSPALDTVVAHSRHLQRLIHPDAVTAGYAVAELLGERPLEQGSPLAATVFELEPLDSQGKGHSLEVPDLGRLVVPAFAALDRASILGVVDGALVLVSTTRSPRNLALRVETALASSLNSAQWRIRGSGTSSTTEWQHGLREVYQDAAFAARIAGRAPEAPRHAVYSELGALVLLRHVPWTPKSVEQISEEAAALVAADNGVNRQTLLAYLRSACSAQETCAELNIHRTTLYYRLERCRPYIGDALEQGWPRLSLHLGLVLAEITEHSGSVND